MLQQSALPSYLQSDRLGPWGIYLQQVDRVAPYLGKLSRWIETLKRPKKSLIVDIPVELDDGPIAHFEGYRIQHNTSRSPAKGGVRVNPHMLSRKEIERITRRYTSEINAAIGLNSDIPAPDVNTNEQVMAWMMDTYSMNQGHTVMGAVTGKPVALGGSLGRREATGRGIFVVGCEAARRKGIDIAAGARIAIQGFGNVGSVAARLFSEAGAKVIAIQDHTGTLYQPTGLDTAKLLMHAAQHGGIAGFEGVQTLNSEEFWRLETDLLIPAALEEQITEKNAPHIRTRIIVEAANG